MLSRVSWGLAQISCFTTYHRSHIELKKRLSLHSNYEGCSPVGLSPCRPLRCLHLVSLDVLCASPRQEVITLAGRTPCWGPQAGVRVIINSNNSSSSSSSSSLGGSVKDSHYAFFTTLDVLMFPSPRSSSLSLMSSRNKKPDT